jgi:hypothetical protein
VARAGLVGLVTLGTWSAFAAIDTERRRWGDTTDVVVAAEALAPGDPMRTVVVVRWPRALVPEEAVVSVDRTATVRRHVGRGEVLTTADVADGNGTMALAPAGWGTVHVPAGDDERALAVVGDEVDVIVSARTVTRGVVVAIGSESLGVAVEPMAVAIVAAGILDRTAAVALVAR